jgi:thiosulfate/3-mercaptopyruvate sulfurtransferase
MINLVDNSWLAQHVEDAQTRIIDPRPRVKYLQGHIPRAVNLPLSEVYDRETLAIHSEERLAEIFGKVGVDLDSTVALYDSYDGQSAAMLAWLLEYLGHPRVMILSNYLEGWVKHGGQILYRPVPAEPKIFSRKLGGRGRALMDEVLQRGDSKLVDLRSEDEFQGKISTESRSGHIPGAVSLPWTELIGKDVEFFKPEQEHRERIAGVGVNLSDRVITYCSNGPRAAIGYVALQQLGFENVQVYDGSFHEWARKPDLPLEKGTIQENLRVRPVAPAPSPCVVENLPGMTPAE